MERHKPCPSQQKVVTNLALLRKRVGMKLGQGPELNASYQTIDSARIYLCFSPPFLLWEIFQTLPFFFFKLLIDASTRHLAPRTEHTTYCDILYCVSISTTYCKRYKQIRCVTLTLMAFYMQILQSSGFLINVFIIPLTLLMNLYFTITLHIHRIPQR